MISYVSLNNLISKIKEKKIKNAVFDFDGTLINSEPYHFQAHKIIMKKLANHNLTKEEYVKKFLGHTNEETYAIFEKEHNLNLNIEEIIKEKLSITNHLLINDKVKIFDYFFKLTSELQDVNFYILSNSNADIIVEMLKINNCLNYFKKIYSLPDLNLNKEYFIENFENLANIDRKSTVIFEDSNSKLKLAKKLNYALVVGVETDMNAGQLIDAEDIIKVDKDGKTHMTNI
ncbi:MAG: HAD family hydrolase [Christensenellales bacterium]